MCEFLHLGERSPGDTHARAWAFVRNGSMGGMRGTNRAEWWEAGVRASLPLPGWMRYLTLSLQATAHRKGQSFNRPRSGCSYLPPPREPAVCPAATRTCVLLTTLRRWSGGGQNGVLTPGQRRGRSESQSSWGFSLLGSLICQYGLSPDPRTRSHGQRCVRTIRNGNRSRTDATGADGCRRSSDICER